MDLWTFLSGLFSRPWDEHGTFTFQLILFILVTDSLLLSLKVILVLQIILIKKNLSNLIIPNKKSWCWIRTVFVFGLVSSFYGISTFVRYLMLKSALQQEQLGVIRGFILFQGY